MNIEHRKEKLPITLNAVVLDCADVHALSDFYIRLLGWETHHIEQGEWVDIAPPGGGTKIAFQHNEDYIPPVWPEQEGRQQQMAHLDFAVKDNAQMALAVEHALACGATMAEQYGGDAWVTLVDPAGHPFCFVIW